MKQQFVIKAVLISLLGAGLAACGGTPTAETPAAPAAQPTTPPQPTIVVPTSAPLDLGISGSGEIKAAQDAGLVFLAQGTIAEVKVEEGDTVKKGDLLAILDTRPIDNQVRQAEAALASAQAQESALTEKPRVADAAAAAAQVRQAQAAINALKQGPKAPDRAQADAGLSTAQTNLQMTRDKLSLAKTAAENQMNQAVTALTAAQARYAQAKAYWEHVQETGTDPVVPSSTNPTTGKKSPNTLSEGARANYASQFQQAEAALRQAEEAVKLAQVNFDNARTSEVTGIQLAQEQINQAQAVVDKLNLPPDQAALAQAQAGLAQAQAAAARLNPDPTDAQTAQVAAGIAQAQAALDLARINRENAELHAPFDGVVAAVNIDPGDPSATGGQPAIQVVDTSKLHLDAQISDIDIGRVSVGQSVEVRADSNPEKVYKGKVSFIAPTASAVGNIRTYLVRITLDDQDGLRAGMSARVDILTG